MLIFDLGIFDLKALIERRALFFYFYRLPDALIAVPDPYRRYRLSLFLNVLLAACLLGIILHEGYIHRIYKRINPPAPQPVIPENSLFYKEQIDFFSIYGRQSNIVMLGNSLTHKIMWNELLGRADIANRGIGGDLVSGMLHRLHYVLALNPKICFIEGGINDVDAGISVDTIAGNLGQIVGRLKSGHVIPVLMTVTYVTGVYPAHDSINASITRLNKLIAGLAAKEKIQVIDLNPSISKNGRLIPAFARNDGNHLTSKAYLIWKAEILQILKDYGI